jgi:hypothetical protein
MLHRVLLISIVLLAAFGGRTADAQAPLPVPLFTALAIGSAADLVDAAPGSLRARGTGVAPSALRSDQLLLELFPDTTLQAELVARQVNEDGSLSWAGRVPGQPLSSVTFVQAGSVLQGSIRLDDAAYSIEPAAGLGTHTIRQVNPDPPGEERVPLQAPAPAQADALDAAATSSDDGSAIDVLVVYTAAARLAAGGTDDAIRARIMLGVTETNTAYANSGVVQRLRLVGAEPIGYTEGGDIGLDLERVTDIGDGFMDSVHARRDQLGADLVSLIVDNKTGSCGVAWLMQTPSVTFAPQAFSVTVYDCISPNYTFGHELGHNMGAAHAPDDPNLEAAYSYAYGYKDPASLFRTVMAYNCPAISCPRILYFSNPGVSYGGRTTGTSERNNNALALNNTRTIVANFRQAVTPGLGAPRSLTVTTSGTTATFAWLPPTTGMATGYVIEAGSASGLANLALLPTGAATSLVVPAVPPGLYFVRVRATNAEGIGAPSAEVQLVMTSQGRCLAPTGPPVLGAATVTGNLVTLSWSAPTTGGPVTSYVVGAGYSAAALDAAILRTGTNATSAVIPAAFGRYFVRVAGENPCGVGTASNEVIVTVGPPLPGPPAGLAATIAPGGAVTLSWNAPASGGAPQTYVLEAGYAPGASSLGTVETAAPATTFRIQAAPGTYYVRVRARNTAGIGMASGDLRVVVQ